MSIWKRDEPAKVKPDPEGPDFDDKSVKGCLAVARWAADEACEEPAEAALGHLIDAVRALADAVEMQQ
jgi:hypothetical protein